MQANGLFTGRFSFDASHVSCLLVGSRIYAFHIGCLPVGFFPGVSHVAFLPEDSCLYAGESR